MKVAICPNVDVYNFKGFLVGDGTEPIEDDEILYRRIVLDQYSDEGGLTRLAFKSWPYDKTGLSVFRAKYTTPKDVAQNDRGKQYWVAELLAGDLRNSKLRVAPRVEGHLPGHAEITSLTYDNRHDDASLEANRRLTHELCLRILGPFPEVVK